MNIFGRHISNSWLLCLPALAILGPFGLLFLVMLGHVGGAFFGPLPIWKQAWSATSREELVGTYVESESGSTRRTFRPPTSLTLSADGSMAVKGLPDMGGAECGYSGTGSWSLDRGQLILRLVSDQSVGSCNESLTFSGPQVTAYSNPRKLYWTIGDPDEGIGIWLKKEK